MKSHHKTHKDRPTINLGAGRRPEEYPFGDVDNNGLPKDAKCKDNHSFCEEEQDLAPAEEEPALQAGRS